MRIFILVMQEFFFFLHGYGKILLVMYRYVKNFGCGKILAMVTFWWGIDFILWWWGIGCKNFFFLGMKFFSHVGLGHEN